MELGQVFKQEENDSHVENSTMWESGWHPSQWMMDLKIIKLESNQNNVIKAITLTLIKLISKLFYETTCTLYLRVMLNPRLKIKNLLSVNLNIKTGLKKRNQLLPDLCIFI